MTTLTSSPVQGSSLSSASRTPSAGDVTFARLLKGEWIKVRTLRSTWWTLGAAVVLAFGVPFLAALATSAFQSPDTSAEGTGIGGWSGILTSSTDLVAAVIGVFAVLSITGEYRTGMIRSTLAAAPRRLDALAAKAVVVAATSAVAAVVGLVLALFATLPFAGKLDLELDLLGSEDGRILLGSVLYCVAWSMFAFAVGALIRHSAGALAIVLALPLIIEKIFIFLPWTATKMIGALMPTNAGARVYQGKLTLETLNNMLDVIKLSPWQGFAVLLFWVALLLGLAGLLLRKRDA